MAANALRLVALVVSLGVIPLVANRAGIGTTKEGRHLCNDVKMLMVMV